VPFPGFQHRRCQRLVDVHPRVGQFDHQVIQLPAKLAAAGATVAAAAGATVAGGGDQPARRQHGEANARQQPATDYAAQPGQQTVLGALDVHRQQRGASLISGQRRAFVDFHQRPGHADPALGKDRHPLASLEMLDQCFQIVRIGRVDADVAGANWSGRC